MDGLLALSLFANACFIYHITKTLPGKENENRYKDYVSNKKIRDNEHRQLLFDYMTMKHNNDAEKVISEQREFYKFAEGKKIFKE